MMKKLIILATMSFVLFPVMAHADLLTNSGFEANSGSGGVATGWTQTGSIGTELWANHTGSWGMATYPWANNGTGDAYQSVPVTAGTTYTYSIWTLRDAGTPTGNYFMKLDWYDTNNTFISETAQNITVPSDAWFQQMLSGTAPTGSTSVHVDFGASSTSLAGKFDDASFDTTAVPEPVSSIMFLLGSGLMGLRHMREKKR